MWHTAPKAQTAFPPTARRVVSRAGFAAKERFVEALAKGKKDPLLALRHRPRLCWNGRTIVWCTGCEEEAGVTTVAVLRFLASRRWVNTTVGLSCVVSFCIFDIVVSGWRNRQPVTKQHSTAPVHKVAICWLSSLSSIACMWAGNLSLTVHSCCGPPLFCACRRDAAV